MEADFGTERDLRETNDVCVLEYFAADCDDGCGSCSRLRRDGGLVSAMKLHYEECITFDI